MIIEIRFGDLSLAASDVIGQDIDGIIRIINALRPRKEPMVAVPSVQLSSERAKEALSESILEVNRKQPEPPAQKEPESNPRPKPTGGAVPIDANWVKSLRKRSGLTIDEFAEALGVTSKSIYRWHSGHGIKPETLERLKAFEASLVAKKKMPATAPKPVDDEPIKLEVPRPSGATVKQFSDNPLAEFPPVAITKEPFLVKIGAAVMVIKSTRPGAPDSECLRPEFSDLTEERLPYIRSQFRHMIAELVANRREAPYLQAQRIQKMSAALMAETTPGKAYVRITGFPIPWPTAEGGCS